MLPVPSQPRGSNISDQYTYAKHHSQHTPLIRGVDQSKSSAKVLTRPSIRRPVSTLACDRAFVRISAGISSVGMCSILNTPFSTHSLSQCQRMSMCFILVWCSGFLATHTADLLSTYIVEGADMPYPTASKNWRTDTASWPAWHAATYSASVDKSATIGCSLLDHDIAPVPIFITIPEVDFAESESPA